MPTNYIVWQTGLISHFGQKIHMLSLSLKTVPTNYIVWQTRLISHFGQKIHMLSLSEANFCEWNFSFLGFFLVVDSGLWICGFFVGL